MYDTIALEFEKILNNVSKYTIWDENKKDILELSPICNIDYLNKMIEEVKEAYQVIISYDSLPLEEASGISNVLKRIEIGGVITKEELVCFISFLKSTGSIKKYYSYLKQQKINISNLEDYFSKINYNDRLKNDISYKVDDDGNIKDNASEELFKIRRTIKSLDNKLHNTINSYLTQKQSLLTEALVASRKGHLCLPFKAEYKNQIKGMILDESSSGTTVYIMPLECGLIEQEILSAKSEEARIILDILKEISLSINYNMEELKQSVENIKILDIIYTKAMYMKEMDYNLPKINNCGYINLKNAKHPLISKESVVAQNITLGDKNKVMIITGPNTGGKTVVLKTTGLLTLMTMCAIAIPASEGSEVSVFDNIFVDIGDEQSIEQSLSTFSSHMKKVKYICDNVNENSLCLIDEIGSGTDPKEGSSLAISIIDYILKRGAKVIVSTHYSLLKEYAYSTDGVINASVEFDAITYKPTYRLLIGVPGKSNAINIAKNLGINETIINNAISINNGGAKGADELMNNLDKENELLREKSRAAEELLNEYNKKMVDLELYKKKIEKERLEILKKASEEACDIISKAKNDSSELISKIDTYMKDKKAKEHELADIKFAARNLKSKEYETTVFDEDLRVGDFVYVKSYDRVGQIKSINKNNYDVQMGQFLMSFKKADLKLTKPPVNNNKYKKPAGSMPAKYAKLELDLRGYRYEEVKDAIDIFIDKAYLANMSQVYIIHGFGTGAVRNAVQAYLKKSPYVKSYRYGGEGEGLNGVTVVTLK